MSLRSTLSADVLEIDAAAVAAQIARSIDRTVFHELRTRRWTRERREAGAERARCEHDDGHPERGNDDACHAELARYAEACPANYGHMTTLVAAERARVRGDVANAMLRYDAAIEAAAEHGYLKVEAIGHELVAWFWRDRGKTVHAGSRP